MNYSNGQHYENVNHDHNLQMSHILCFIKTKIHHDRCGQIYEFIKKFIYFNP
jgi:hypothetical protein